MKTNIKLSIKEGIFTYYKAVNTPLSNNIWNTIKNYIHDFYLNTTSHNIIKSLLKEEQNER
jgi:hypothetical protein